MAKSHFIVFSALVAICASQRPPYAGRRPIGFPVIETTTSANSQNNSLGNRFGEKQNVTTERLPVEALGDRELFNRLGQFPLDQQPFWYINWKALEENRKNLQTYPIRPSVFNNPNKDVITRTDSNLVNAQSTSQNNQTSNQPPILSNQLVSSNSEPIQRNQSLSNNLPMKNNPVSQQNSRVSSAS